MGRRKMTTRDNCEKDRFTLQDLKDKDYKFRIPLYQRPYAWQEEHVTQLLNDINKPENNDEQYYLGIVTIAETNEDNCYDLIDGQQRLTTLLLIATAAKKNIDSEDVPLPNLEFYGRDNDKEFFENPNSPNEDCNQLLVNAYKNILAFLNSESKEQLQNFIDKLNNVTVFLAKIPKDYSIADKNHFFVRMNNRGKQLEKHEILKVKLISQLENLETSNQSVNQQKTENSNETEVNKQKELTVQQKYFLKWNRMESIFSGIAVSSIKEFDKKLSAENNTKATASAVDKAGSTAENVDAPQKAETEENSDFICLEQLLSSEDTAKAEIQKKESLYQPILTIEEFLLIALERYEQNSSVLYVKEKLLGQFKAFERSETPTEKIKNFLDLLFYQLTLLEKYFIFKSGDEHKLGLKPDLKNNNDDNEGFIIKDNKKTKEDLKFLQAYLAASTEPQHWLVDAFNWLKSEDEKGTISLDNFIEELERIDNLLCWESEKEEEKTNNGLSTKSRRILQPKFTDLNDISKLEYPNISHYWFYRIDYELWKLWKSQKNNSSTEQNTCNLWTEDNKNNKKLQKILDNFKFRKLNSIEHVIPQTNDDSGKPQIDDDLVNLALLSVSQNSKFSNYPEEHKKTTIIEKEKSESLKMTHRLWYGEERHNVCIKCLLAKICANINSAINNTKEELANNTTIEQ